jgi:NADH dehydrogenase
VPFPIAGLLGRAGDIAAMAGFPPPITSDQVEMLKVDNVVAPGALGLTDLGITPQAIESVLGSYLYRYRRGGQYAELSAAAAATARR